MVLLRTKEETLALANLDPEIDAILKSGKFKYPPIDYSSTTAAITSLREAAGRFPPPPAIPEVKEWVVKFITRDSIVLRLVVFRPSAVPSTAALPLLVFYHGGGGAMGSPEETAPICRDIALNNNVVVVAPQYRLGPEDPFPAGVCDAEDSLRYIAANAEKPEFGGVDLNLGFLVGGSSNGAGLASVLAMKAKEENWSFRITGLWLAAGGYVGEQSHLSARYREAYYSATQLECVDALILDRKTKAVFTDAYKPKLGSTDFRVLNNAEEKFEGYPKSYLQICGQDINRDDGLIFEDVLKDNGVQTRTDIYPGCPHVFWGIFRTTKQAQKWKQDSRDGVAWLLGKL